MCTRKQTLTPPAASAPPHIQRSPNRRHSEIFHTISITTAQSTPTHRPFVPFVRARSLARCAVCYMAAAATRALCLLERPTSRGAVPSMWFGSFNSNGPVTRSSTVGHVNHHPPACANGLSDGTGTAVTKWGFFGRCAGECTRNLHEEVHTDTETVTHTHTHTRPPRAHTHKCRYVRLSDA